MNILKNIKVPTGNIVVVQGDYGKLELLSLGDYGQENNIKADFLGLNRTPERVTHRKLLPLEEKWVVTISTQYGCRIGCSFCDVSKVNNNPKNATCRDIINQVLTAVYNLHLGVNSSKRLNIHFARMGEPTFNPYVLEAIPTLYQLFNKRYNIHPVISTMMPNNNEWLQLFIASWMGMKNDFLDGNAGLQISVNSTDEKERSEMFNNQCLTLEQIHYRIMRYAQLPRGRKITLNFAVADYTIDPSVLLKYFDPMHYIIKLTPMHRTKAAIDNGLLTKGDASSYYPYEELDRKLTAAGYDVLVFLASEEEDNSAITCGNAILGGSEIRTEHEYLKTPDYPDRTAVNAGFNDGNGLVRKTNFAITN